MEESLPARELHFDLSSTSEKASESLQSVRCDLRVGALVTSFEVGVARDVLLVVLRPHFVQITVYMKALRVWNSNGFTPASQRLTTTVGVVSVLLRTGSLRNHPIDCHLGDVSCVRGAIASTRKPFTVASLAACSRFRLKLPDEFQRSQWAASRPLQSDRWVSILVDELVKVRRWTYMPVSRAMTTPVDFPRSCVAFGITEFRSASNERCAHPALLPLLLVMSRLLDSVYIFSRPQSEDKEVVRLDETLKKLHQAPRVLRGPFLCESFLQFHRSRDGLRNRCGFALGELVLLHMFPDGVDSWKVRFGFVGMDWSPNQLVSIGKAFAHSLHLRKSQTSLLPNLPHNRLRLTIGQRALLRHAPANPSVSVFRVKASDFTNLVTFHNVRDFLPAEFEAVANDFHSLVVTLGILFSLDLGPLSSIAEELRLLLKTLRSSRSLLGSLLRSCRWLSSSFSFPSTERQLEKTSELTGEILGYNWCLKSNLQRNREAKHQI